MLDLILNISQYLWLYFIQYLQVLQEDCDMLHLNCRDIFAIYALSLLYEQVTASYSKYLLLDSISCASSLNVVTILLYYLCPPSLNFQLCCYLRCSHFHFSVSNTLVLKLCISQ